jgi:hypothetical protein
LWLKKIFEINNHKILTLMGDGKLQESTLMVPITPFILVFVFLFFNYAMAKGGDEDKASLRNNVNSLSCRNSACAGKQRINWICARGGFFVSTTQSPKQFPFVVAPDFRLHRFGS